MKSMQFSKAISTPNLTQFVRHSTLTQAKIYQVYLYGDKPIEERKNQLLGPSQEWPFSGHVKFSTPIKPNKQNMKPEKEKPAYRSEMAKCTKLLNLARLQGMLSNWVEADHYYRPAADITDSDRSIREVETQIAECPLLFKAALKEVFGEHLSLANTNRLLAISITQLIDDDSIFAKNGGDCDPDDQKIDEAELLRLSSNFIEIADAVCTSLKELNCWADFIDPRSGKPYLSEPRKCLLELDEQYTNSGFNIKEIAACKVTRQIKWDKETFVGTIFTDTEPGLLKEVLTALGFPPS
jgi:hypothetical protein